MTTVTIESPFAGDTMASFIHINADMLPERHSKLLFAVCKLSSSHVPENRYARQVSADEVIKFANKYLKNNWDIYIGPEDEPESPRLIQDLEYLHRRGYIVMRPDLGVVPTAQSEARYRRVIDDHTEAGDGPPSVELEESGV